MGEDREMEAALDCYAHENRELRAEVERLKCIGEGLAAVATGGDAMLARADDFARRARGSEHDRLPELFYEAIGEGRMAMTSEVERLKREAQPEHTFVPGDPACGWERQCAVVVPVTECGRVVGAHCGLPPEDHALWASARDEDAAAIRAATKEER